MENWVPEPRTLNPSFFSVALRVEFFSPPSSRKGGPSRARRFRSRVDLSRILCPSYGRRSFIWDRRCRRPRARYPSLSHTGRLRTTDVPTSSGPGTACACTRWGLPCPDCRQPGGALLPHLFTLACVDTPARSRWDHRRSVFCGTFPSPATRGRWALPITVSFGVRTFLRVGQGRDGDRLSTYGL